jgi:hypothetical protein
MVESQEQGPYYQISDTKNVDLLRERQSATFDVEQLSQFMFGGTYNYFDLNKRRQLSTINANLIFSFNATFFLLLFSSSSLCTSCS